MNGDVFGTGTTTALDVLQGDPSRVRDLAVGFGAIRTIRAEASAKGPEVAADLRLVDGRLQGTVTNRSAKALEAAAIVVGSAAGRLNDIAPGATATVDLPIAVNQVNWNSMSERIFGPMNWDGSALDEAGQRTMVRRSVIDQISVDPITGFPNAIPSDSATLLAWGTEPVVPMELEGQTVQRMANVLYQVPLPYSISGKTTFANDLVRASVLEVGANFFSKDPSALSLGPGTARISYRPVPFEGTFTPSRLIVTHDVRRRRRAARRQPQGPGGEEALRAGHRRVRRAPGRPAGHRGPRPADRHVGPVRAHAPRTPRTSWPTPPAGWIRRAARSRSGSSTSARTRIYFQFPVRIEGTDPMTGIVRATGLVKRYDKTARRGGARPRRGRGRDLRPRRVRTARARRRRCGSWPRSSCPDRGDAEIAGASVRRNPNDVRRVLGFMPDCFGVYDDMKVWEYLDFFARCYGIPADRRRRMIGDLLELVDLGLQARRLRPGPVAGHAAAPVPRPHARPRPAGAAARRAGLGPRPAGPRRAARAAAGAAHPGQDDPRLVPHPPRARGAVHLGRDHRPRPGPRPRARRRDREAAAGRRRAAGARPRRRRRARGSAGLVLRPAGRRHGGPPGRRHDRDRLPRRRRRIRPAARPRGRRPACESPPSPGRRATSRSCSCRSRPRSRSTWRLRHERPGRWAPSAAAGASAPSATSGPGWPPSASRSCAAGCAAGARS